MLLRRGSGTYELLTSADELDPVSPSTSDGRRYRFLESVPTVLAANDAASLSESKLR